MRQPRVAAQQVERQAPPPDARGAVPAPPGGAHEPFVGGNVVNRPPEQRRMGGRMTVEERQALRRQINEAGRDIYAPKK